jgi:hypothetical protein
LAEHPQGGVLGVRGKSTDLSELAEPDTNCHRLPQPGTIQNLKVMNEKFDIEFGSV